MPTTSTHTTAWHFAGGMTPRSLVASGRVNSGRLGSPRAGSQSLAPLAQPARQGSGATASKTGSESSKPVIAFGKLLPLTPALQVAGRPHHGGSVSTEESLGTFSVIFCCLDAQETFCSIPIPFQT